MNRHQPLLSDSPPGLPVFVERLFYINKSLYKSRQPAAFFRFVGDDSALNFPALQRVAPAWIARCGPACIALWTDLQGPGADECE
jgi:hypothetical protein